MTGISLAISSVCVLPVFYQVMTSTRVAMPYLDMGFTSIHIFLNKVVYIFPIGILFTLTIKQLCLKNDKKINIWFILILIYTLIGIFIEPFRLCPAKIKSYE